MKKAMVFVMMVMVTIAITAAKAVASPFDDAKAFFEDNVPVVRGEDYERKFKDPDGGSWTVVKDGDLYKATMIMPIKKDGYQARKGSEVLTTVSGEIRLEFYFEEFNPTIQASIEDGTLEIY